MPNRSSGFLLTASSAAIIALALSAPASAQEAATQVPVQPQNVPQATEPTKPAGPGATAAQPSAPAATGQVEEIVITAERREQRLQDVPISASVFSANEIARRGITSVADLQQAAPSVAINTVNRSTFINIRGVGIAQSAPTSNPGIAYYLDGQLIPHEQFIGQSFYDIGSIEVLRGPQGTLTGQNSTGGAIYVRTPEPRFDRFSGFVEGTVANYGLFRATGAVNLPISNNIAARVSAVHDQRDSFTDNIYAPTDSRGKATPGDYKLDAARINIAIRSTDERLKVNLRGEYFAYRTDNIPVKNRNDLAGIFDPVNNPADPRLLDEFTIREDALSYLDQRGYRLSGEVRYDVTDGIQVRGLTSWQDGYTHDQADGDRGVRRPLPQTPAPATQQRGRVGRASTDFRTFINELNLISTSKGPVNWVVGAFRLDEDVPLTQWRDDFNTRDITSSSLVRTVTEAHNTSTSVFGQVNWFVMPQLEVLAGGRHSWDKQVYDQYEVNRANVSITTPVAPLAFTGVQKSTEFTGKLGVNYHINSGNMVYVTASKGYKAGGVNLGIPTAAVPVIPNFGPETNVVYEAGFKTEFLDRHLRANGDVFHSNYKDIQFASLSNGLPLTQNAASGRSWGAELELTGQFHALSFNTGIGYLDAEFGEDVCLNNTNNAPGTPALCSAGNEFVPKGRVLPFSPKWTVNAGVQYAFDLGSGLLLTPRLQGSHISSQTTTPFPAYLNQITPFPAAGAGIPVTIMPKHTVLDARLTLDVSDRYRAEVYVTNLTDKTYIASQIQNASSANGGIIYGAPRQYGLRLTAKF